MALKLEGIYKAIVKKIEKGKIYVDIPELKFENTPITEGLFSFSFSKTGYYPQLPKENDIVYIFFEDANFLRPVLIFFGNDKIENLKENETKFAVKKFKIVNEASENENIEYVLIDFENKKIEIKINGEIEFSSQGANSSSIANIVTNKTHPICPYTGLPIKGHAKIKTDVDGVQ